MIHQIWILSGEKEFDNFNINSLNEFNSIILIDYINREDIINKIKFFENLKNYSLPNCKKILININGEDFEDSNSILKDNEIEYFKINKDILIKQIKKLFPIIEKHIIKYINLRKPLNMKTFQDNKTCNKEKSKNEGAKGNKYIDSNESSSFLSENDFGEKIFNLFNMLKEYNRDDVEKIYDLLDFLYSESEKLKDIIDSLPLITYKNEYFASYYYYLIIL